MRKVTVSKDFFLLNSPLGTIPTQPTCINCPKCHWLLHFIRDGCTGLFWTKILFTPVWWIKQKKHSLLICDVFTVSWWELPSTCQHLYFSVSFFRVHSCSDDQIDQITHSELINFSDETPVLVVGSFWLSHWRIAQTLSSPPLSGLIQYFNILFTLIPTSRVQAGLSLFLFKSVQVVNRNKGTWRLDPRQVSKSNGYFSFLQHDACTRYRAPCQGPNLNMLPDDFSRAQMITCTTGNNPNLFLVSEASGREVTFLSVCSFTPFMYLFLRFIHAQFPLTTSPSSIRSHPLSVLFFFFFLFRNTLECV